MEIQSSYIFLHNQFNKENDSVAQPTNTDSNVRNISINVPKQVIQYLAESFPYIVDLTEHPTNAFFNKYSSECSDRGNSFTVSFSLYTISSITYLDVSVKGKRKEQIIRQLEKMQEQLLNSGIRDRYIDIISYDSISEYYCNKLAPLLNETERNIRALLINMFTLHFQSDYYKLVVDKCNKQKIFMNVDQSFLKGEMKQNIREKYHTSNNKEVEAVARMQHVFESMKYSEIQTLLFSKTWTDQDEKQKDEFLQRYEDLTKLTDDELRRAIESFSPKSHWDRFFREKMNDPQIEDIVEQIRICRNTIAHFKPLSRESYNEYQKIVVRFNNDLLHAIELTKKEDFSKKFSSDISRSLVRTLEILDAFYKKHKAEILENLRNGLTVFSNALSLLSTREKTEQDHELDKHETDNPDNKKEPEQND